MVLAAGKGTRMGGPKALMRIGRTAWWREQRDALEVLGREVVWVVSQGVRDALRAEGDGPERVVLADSDAPMFASVLAGVRAALEIGAGGVYLIPVDVPAAAAGVWDQLSGRERPSIPEFAGEGGHPVYLPGSWIEERLAPYLAADDTSGRLDELLEGEAERVEVDDPAVVCNLNTPEDVARWLASREEDA